MATYEQSQSEKDNNRVEILRQTSMEAILEAEGYDTRHKAKGNYHSPFREDKDPSFHIDEANHRWYDHGSGEGGDVITLVQKLKNLSFADALSYLEAFNPDFSVAKATKAPARPEVKTSTALSGSVNHSGGDIGSDTEWEETGKMYGVVSKHYYHGNRTPRGNTLVSEEDFKEGLEKVRKAAVSLGRHTSNPAILDLLGRNWMQVKNADAVFAIGIIGNIRHQVGQNDVFWYREVQGGTGWAVQMAIDEGKPVFVFDQATQNWYRFDKSVKDCWLLLDEAPALTKNFAGVGTRQISPEGKAAIAAAYKATIKHLLEQGNENNFIDEVDRSKTINIWAGSSENTILSNLAIRPFVIEGIRFDSVEQRFQYRKAKFFGDEETAKQILGADSPAEAKLWGRHVKGFDAERWGKVAPKEMESAIKLSFMANPSAAEALLSTGNALLTHTQEKGVWGEEFPRILMKVRHSMQKSLLNEQGEYKGAAAIEIREISKEITSNTLRKYEIKDRGIHPNALEKYCSQIKYTVEYQKNGEQKKMTFMAIGFPNRSKEWTLRGAPYSGNSSGIKRSTGNDATIIDKNGEFCYGDKVQPSCGNVVIFEGFNNFLSWLSWRGQLEPGNTDVVVLNSTVNLDRVMDYISVHNNVFTYLDADKTGIDHTKLIQAECEKNGRSFKDCSYVYADKNLNDLNDAWKVIKAKRQPVAHLKSIHAGSINHSPDGADKPSQSEATKQIKEKKKVSSPGKH